MTGNTGILSILEKGRIKLNDLYGEMSLYNSVYIETLKGSNFIQFYLEVWFGIRGKRGWEDILCSMTYWKLVVIKLAELYSSICCITDILFPWHQFPWTTFLQYLSSLRKGKPWMNLTWLPKTFFLLVKAKGRACK